MAVGSVVVGLASASVVAGQSAPSKGAATAKGYVVPRTASGQPDLQGVWANNLATPLERPKEFANKPVLTDEELNDLKAKAARLFASGGGDAVFGDGLYTAVLADPEKYVSTDGKTGDYNQFWLVDREWEHRTSLVTDPTDGRIPQVTAHAKKRQDEDAAFRREHPFDSADTVASGLRCITYGVPRLGGLTAGYNSYYQIVQSAEAVAINNEMYHETRVIPLDGRPHPSRSINGWLGDSRGHWEGNTLVVDTTNFSPKANYRGAHENLHVVERFTRVGPNTLDYQVTVDDPSTWTKPWTGLIHLAHSPDQIYEFACHEGNIAMGGILRGARMEEKAAAEKKASR